MVSLLIDWQLNMKDVSSFELETPYALGWISLKNIENWLKIDNNIVFVKIWVGRAYSGGKT